MGSEYPERTVPFAGDDCPEYVRATLTARVEAQAARIEELEGALEVIGRRADKTLLEASSRRDLEDGLSLVGMRASRALQARGDDDGS